MIAQQGRICPGPNKSAQRCRVWPYSYSPQALAKTPLSLMRLVPLVIFWIKSKLAGTERAKVSAARVGGVQGPPGAQEMDSGVPIVLPRQAGVHPTQLSLPPDGPAGSPACRSGAGRTRR